MSTAFLLSPVLAMSMLFAASPALAVLTSGLAPYQAGSPKAARLGFLTASGGGEAMNAYTRRGVSALDAADYPEAERCFRLGAEDGDGWAMLYLGWLHEFRRVSGQPEFREAERWYRLSVRSGNVVATNNLGLLYAKGHVNGAQDYREAERWYRQGVRGGDGWAMSNLGKLYEEGLGRPRNPLVAFLLHEMSARSGFLPGQHAAESARQPLSPAELAEAGRLLDEGPDGARLLELIDAILKRPGAS